MKIQKERKLYFEKKNLTSQPTQSVKNKIDRIQKEFFLQIAETWPDNYFSTLQ